MKRTVGLAALIGGPGRSQRPLFSSRTRRARRRSRRPGRVAWVALVAGALASTGLTTPPAAVAATSGALGGAGPAPGTIFVANGGADGYGSTGIGPGSITIYHPGASGDARPEAVITKGIDGPLGLAFDSSGNLWVANFASSVAEYSKAELAKPSPAPTRTILVAGHAGAEFQDRGGIERPNHLQRISLIVPEVWKIGRGIRGIDIGRG